MNLAALFGAMTPLMALAQAGSLTLQHVGLRADTWRERGRETRVVDWRRNPMQQEITLECLCKQDLGTASPGWTQPRPAGR